MIEDRPERKMYRKSPGRQYGYEYDPLHSQSLSRYGQQGQSDVSVQSQSWDDHDETGSRSNRRTSGLLAPRPNPRRTRQLLRQNIIASKSKSGLLDDTGQLDPELRGRYPLPDEDPGIYESEVDPTLYSNRYPRTSQLLSPPPEQYVEEKIDEEQLAGEELQYMDPDPGYDEYEEYDPLANRLPAAPHQTPLRHTALEEERAVDWYEDSDYYKESGLPRSHIFPGLHPAGDSGRATRDQAARYHLKGPILICWQ